MSIKNILKNVELKEKEVVEGAPITADGGKEYKVKYYNLDTIISVR